MNIPVTFQNAKLWCVIPDPAIKSRDYGNGKVYIFKCFLFLFLFFSCSSVFAVNSPTVMLQNIANKMLSYLQQHQQEIAKNPRVITHIVEQVLVPQIDANRMAGLVIGRQIWQSATPMQRQAFIDQFKNLVILTYANALASYNNDRVQIYPLRDSYVSHALITVNSAIIRANGQRIMISYNLINKGNDWKIYDFSIENVSMVRNYQSQFANTLSQGGLTALIQKLQTYNREQS